MLFELSLFNEKMIKTMSEHVKGFLTEKSESSIALSRFLPLTGRVNEFLTFIYRKVMKTRVNKRYFLQRLRKQLKRTDVKLDLLSRDEDLYLELQSDNPLPFKEQILSSFQKELLQALNENLMNAFTDRPMIYITRDMEIPLIGHTAFGIIVRGTNIIEIRPISGCPLRCIFCSVDEGRNSSTRQTDYMIEPEFLFEEVSNVASFLGNKSLELHVSAQGEPTTYPYLADLVEKLATIEGVEQISMQTSGVLLDESSIRALEKAGLTRINLSVNCMDAGKAKALAGTSNYDLEHVKMLIKLISDTDISLLISPVVVPKVSEGDMDEIIQYLKKLGLERFYQAPLGIQNYLEYQLSRKVKGIKPWSWDEFHAYLRNLERRYGVSNLILDQKRDFQMEKRKELPKPFRKGEVVRAKIKAPGRIKGELLAVARNRIIQVIKGTKKIGTEARIKIERTKNNIFTGRIIG